MLVALLIPLNGSKEELYNIDSTTVNQIIELNNELNKGFTAPGIKEKSLDDSRFTNASTKNVQMNKKVIANSTIKKAVKKSFKKIEKSPSDKSLTWKKIKKENNFKIKTALPIEVGAIKIKVSKIPNWSKNLDSQLAILSSKLKKIEIAESKKDEDFISTKMAKNIAMDYPTLDLIKKAEKTKEQKNIEQLKLIKKDLAIKREELDFSSNKEKVIDKVKNKETLKKEVIVENKKIEESSPKKVSKVAQLKVRREPAVITKEQEIEHATKNEYPRAVISNPSFEEVLSSHPVYMNGQVASHAKKKMNSQKESSQKSHKSILKPNKISKRKELPKREATNTVTAAKDPVFNPIQDIAANANLVASNDTKLREEATTSQSPSMQKALEEFVKVPKKENERAKRRTIKKGSNKTVKANLSIRAYEVEMNKGPGEYVQNFEIQKLYDDKSYPIDSRMGLVSISEKLSSKTGTALINIRKSGFYETKVQALLEEGTFAMNIPFFEKGSFDKFMATQKVQGTGGYILIEMDERTKSVELFDSKYFTNFFLNDNFQPVSGEETVAYILFVGVEPGNGLLSYETKTGDKIDKIVHVSEEEVLFEVNSYREKDIDTLVVEETEVFGKASTDFELLPKHMTAFNSIKKPVQIGPSRFEFKWPKADLAFRNYIEFSHLADKIYVGYKENKNIEIPTNDFIVHVFKQFGVENIENRCLTQINLSNRPLESTLGAFSSNGPMNYKMLYQDQNGKFYDEISEKTRKIFILGEFQGMINASVKYKNGGKDFITTPCSDDTYLVEQI